VPETHIQTNRTTFQLQVNKQNGMALISSTVISEQITLTRHRLYNDTNRLKWFNKDNITLTSPIYLRP